MIALIITLLLAVTPLTAAAAPPDVMTIVKQMKEIYESSRPSTRQVIITTDGPGGEKTQWIAGQAIKKLPDGKRFLMVILSPESLKGNAFLIQERAGKPNSMWMYLPALRRIRELVPVDVYQHFLDTDFTYADLGFVRLEATYRFLGEEQHARVQAYKIEEVVPQDRAYYSRIVTWVTADSMLPLQRDYYDVAGTLWKAERFEDVATIDGVPTPLHITMHDVQGKTRTEFKIQHVRYDIDVADGLFEPFRLPEVVNAPLWNGYDVRVATEK